MNEDRELGWNDSIEKDGAEFTLIPEGEYHFQVAKFERARHAGSAKLPPCNKAVLSIDIFDEDGRTISTISHNLFLHSKTEGMLCQFFRSIGARKSGEKLVMDWNYVVGKNGRCKVIVKKEDSKKDPGKTMEFNNIQKFLDPADGGVGFKEGVF